MIPRSRALPVCFLLAWFVATSLDVLQSLIFVCALPVNLINPKYNQHDFLFTCLIVSNSLCLAQNSHVIVPPAVYPNLAAYWSFDRLFAVDESGGGNHFHPGFRPAPPVYGVGASAHLHPSVPNSVAYVVSSKLRSSPFTIAFWFYVLDNPESTTTKLFFTRGSLLSLGVTPTGNNLEAKIGTTVLRSNAAFLPRRWTHIALTVPSSGNATIYWNGMKDAFARVAPLSFSTASTITLGHPADKTIAAEPNTLEAYIDELSVFDTDFTAESVNALTIPSLTGIGDPTVLVLGKASSTPEEVNSPIICPPDYHVCFRQELYDFGFRIARIQGFLKASTSRVWYGDVLPPVNVSTEGVEAEQRMALCCAKPGHCVGL